VRREARKKNKRGDERGKKWEMWDALTEQSRTETDLSYCQKVPRLCSLFFLIRAVWKSRV
jgi:hypothetical protein